MTSLPSKVDGLADHPWDLDYYTWEHLGHLGSGSVARRGFSPTSSELKDLVPRGWSICVHGKSHWKNGTQSELLDIQNTIGGKYVHIVLHKSSEKELAIAAVHPDAGRMDELADLIQAIGQKAKALPIPPKNRVPMNFRRFTSDGPRWTSRQIAAEPWAGNCPQLYEWGAVGTR